MTNTKSNEVKSYVGMDHPVVKEILESFGIEEAIAFLLVMQPNKPVVVRVERMVKEEEMEKLKKIMKPYLLTEAMEVKIPNEEAPKETKKEEEK